MTDLLPRTGASAAAWVRRELTIVEGPGATDAAVRALAAGGIIGVLAWSVGSITLGGIAFFGACRVILLSARGAPRQQFAQGAAAAIGGLTGLAVAGSTSHDPVTATVVAMTCGFASGVLGVRGPAWTAFSPTLMIGLAYGQFSHSPTTPPQQYLWYSIGAATVILLTALPRHNRPRPRFALPTGPAPSHPMTNGLRIALCTAPATAIAATIPSNHSFWLPLTVATIVRVEYGAIVSRTINRVAGTVVGSIAAAILIHLSPAPISLAAAAITALAFAALAGPELYGLSVTGITIAVLLTAELSAPSPVSPLLRVGDTIVGAAIALTLGLLIRPKRTPRTARQPRQGQASSRRRTTSTARP